jgi:hypothetical protein
MIRAAASSDSILHLPYNIILTPLRAVSKLFRYISLTLSEEAGARMRGMARPHAPRLQPPVWLQPRHLRGRCLCVAGAVTPYRGVRHRAGVMSLKWFLPALRCYVRTRRSKFALSF